MTIDKLSRAFAVVDTEWSDGSPATARLVSIAVERHEPGGTVSSNYWVVNPMTSISAEATEVHGIRNEDVADKPEFATIAEEVAAALRECDIGGYGVRGDVQLIELEMDRAEVDWSPTGAAIIDGLRMWQVLEGRKLEDAYKKFVGPLPDNAATHHAAYDVEMTTAVIAALRGTKTMQEIHDETNENMVDVAGKFRLDQGKRIVFAFGQYRGAVAASHPGFLQWMLGKDFPPSTLDVARKLLDELHASWETPVSVEAGDDGGYGTNEGPPSDIPI